MHFAFLISMFCSGAAALAYEIVWLRLLGDLLGQDVYAITVVLTVFFAGLGLGGWWFGRLADRRRGPIGLYVLLEMTIALFAVAFGPLLALVDGWYARWSPAEWSWQASLVTKGTVSLALLIVPTLAMGGTLTALSRHVLVRERGLAGGFGWLYGANTVGAAAGVLVATFVSIPLMGVRCTALLAVGFNALAAIAAIYGARSPRDSAPRAIRRAPAAGTSPGHGPKVAARRKRGGAAYAGAVPLVIAFTTGFVSLGFEVLWTRGLSVRFMSGVYSLAIILCVYLLCIGVGAMAVSWLDRRGWVTPGVCAAALIAAGWAGMLSPLVLAAIQPTSDALYTGQPVGFLTFELRQFALALAVMAGALLLFGLNLPIVVRLATADVSRVGSSVGAVYLANSIGGVLAPVAVGFLVMPAVGLGASFALLGGLLVLVGALVVMPWSQPAQARRWRALALVVPATAACVAATLLVDVRAWKSHPRATLVAYREGVAAAVNVVDHPHRGRVLQIGTGYTLGGSVGSFMQQRQGIWPFVLQPGAQRALFLGLGTGSTVGAAFQIPDVRIDALEIVTDVLPMLHYLDDVNYGLSQAAASSERLRLLSVDGRHFVRATDRRYDVVVGDLFEPWRRGVGTMYTIEHFTSAKRVLADGGTFWQWLPLYQLDARERDVVIRTFCCVFEHVEVWWLGFTSQQPAVGLVGRRGARSVSADAVRLLLRRGGLQPVLQGAGFVGVGPVVGSYVCGRATLVSEIGDGPVNTVDQPFVEFHAPRSLTRRSGRWAAENIQRMFALAGAAQGDNDDPFADDQARALADRYRRSIRGMFVAQQQQQAGQLTQAIESVDKALQNTPQWAFPAEWLEFQLDGALQHGRSDVFDRALAALRSVSTQDHRVAYWRARRALAQQQPAQAMRHLRESVRLEPDHQPSVELLRQLERRLGAGSG